MCKLLMKTIDIATGFISVIISDFFFICLLFIYGTVKLTIGLGVILYICKNKQQKNAYYKWITRNTSIIYWIKKWLVYLPGCQHSFMNFSELHYVADYPVCIHAHLHVVYMSMSTLRRMYSIMRKRHTCGWITHHDPFPESKRSFHAAGIVIDLHVHHMCGLGGTVLLLVWWDVVEEVN